MLPAYYTITILSNCNSFGLKKCNCHLAQTGEKVRLFEDDNLDVHIIIMDHKKVSAQSCARYISRKA